MNSCRGHQKAKIQAGNGLSPPVVLRERQGDFIWHRHQETPFFNYYVDRAKNQP